MKKREKAKNQKNGYIKETNEERNGRKKTRKVGWNSISAKPSKLNILNNRKIKDQKQKIELDEK